MKLTFLGQSCVHIQTANHSLIIDPFLSGNPVANAKPEDMQVDAVLLTHGHGDHVGDTEQIAKHNDAIVVAPFELATYLGWQGCHAHAMHIGGAHTFPFGRVTLTQAFHGSGLVIEEKQQIVYMGMPAGIVFEADGKTIYHAGDTALFSDMQLIGRKYDIDLAFLPIGDNYTMGPEDATIAAEWVGAKHVVPVHYNTFPLIEQDGEAFAQALKEKGIAGHALAVDESIEL